MKTTFAAAVLLLVAACEKPLTFVAYEPPSKEFSVEVPAGWRLDDRGGFDRKPLAEVRWIGKVVEEQSGEIYGAVLSVRRISRLRKDFAGAKEYATFKKNVLDKGEQLASGKAGVPVTRTPDGFRYGQQYEAELGGLQHGAVRKLPMQVETIVRRTPAYDYVLELRATRPLFNRYLPALVRLNDSFKVSK